MHEDRIRDQRLIEVGLELFGRRGLDGVGTREIAAAAGRPMSTITYQFGGKEGLYRACAEHIATRIGAMVGAVDTLPLPDDAAAARAQIALIMRAMTAAIVREETGDFARFIMREQQEPTEAFEIIYGGMMGQMAEQVTRLLVRASDGRLSDAQARVRTITLMGQVMAFRVARAAALRLNGWDDIGPDQFVAIDAAVQANLAAILDQLSPREAP